MKKYLIGTLACVLVFMTSNAAARELSLKEKNTIEAAAKGSLKDPDSAKFQWQDYKGGDVYCAHVNAKNSYGGYSGNALMIVGVKTDSNGQINWAQVAIHSDDMATMMAPICTKRGYSA